MKRGENNDYTIEYANAEVTFTPNRLITSASRITVDFEYTDRQYQRNFFGTNIKTNFFDEKLKIKVGYAQEGDDPDNPIDFVLSDEEKQILEEAGDDRSKAVRSGVRLADLDSTGRRIGTYIQIDTVFNSEPFNFYVYSPGDTNAVYNVSFTYVGDGNGDYIKESLGNYKFVGIGGGSYLPIIYIPTPQLKQFGNIVVEAEPWEDVNISLEFAGSSWDKNRFSSLDRNDNLGHARNLMLQVKPKLVEIGNISFGKIGFSVRDRFIHNRYTSLDRIGDIEFNREYNTSEDVKENEELREFGLDLVPIDELKINSKYGLLKKGDQFKSNRFFNKTDFKKENTYSVNNVVDYVNTKRNNNRTDWLRLNGDANYLIWKFKPGIEYLSENKKNKFNQKDSLLTGSLKYLEIAPYLEIIKIFDLSATAKYSVREESSPINGVMEKESEAYTHNYTLDYKGIKEVSSSLNFTFRKKKFKEKFRLQGFSDNETILIRSQSRFNFWERLANGSLYYQVTTERSARLEKVFIRVEEGTGNYKYLGDLNNNGIADEDEFEPTMFEGDYTLITVPSDQLFPVIDLQVNTRWKIDFSRIFTDEGFLRTIFKPLTTVTFVRIEENSREEDTKKIYLLKFSHFLNDSTTIRGSHLFEQDLHLFKNSSELSFRFRFTQRRSLNQFSGGVERGYFRERGVRIRFKMVKEITNQTEFINPTDNVSSSVTTNRARLLTNNEVITDFSYRPIRNLEVGFRFTVGRNQDDMPASPTIIDLNAQTIRVSYSFTGKGRIRAEAERNELNANTAENIIPFEMTRGKVIGKNYFWRLNFDYRIGSNLQTTLSYDGRLQGAGKVINTMRAEARAYF